MVSARARSTRLMFVGIALASAGFSGLYALWIPVVSLEQPLSTFVYAAVIAALVVGALMEYWGREDLADAVEHSGGKASFSASVRWTARLRTASVLIVIAGIFVSDVYLLHSTRMVRGIYGLGVWAVIAICWILADAALAHNARSVEARVSAPDSR